MPLYWVAKRVRWAEVAHHAADVGALAIFGSFVALLASSVAGAIRWKVMLHAYGATNTPPILTLLRHNLVGVYFNVLPGAVAGDIVRALRVRRCTPDDATSYTVTFVERIAGLFGLCSIAATAMALSADLHDDRVAQALELGVLGAFGLSSLVMALPYVLDRRPEWKSSVARVPVIGGIVTRIPPARSLKGPLLAVLLSVATQGFVVISISFLIRPLSSAATMLVCARVIPAIVLVTYIPLTPGGLGQREAAFAYLFGLAHVPAEASVATSLMFFAIFMSLAGLGGLCLLAERLFDIKDVPR